MERIWEGYDLSEQDRQYITIVLNGDISAGCKLVIATNAETGSIICGLCNKLAPIGYFDMKINSILNTVEYANGEEPELSPLHSQKINIYKINDSLLFSIETKENISHQIVKCIFDNMKPKEIFILSSTHESLFSNKEITIPSLFTFAKENNEGKLDGLIIEGVAAGLMTLSEVYNVKCQVYFVIENDYGESADSVKLYLEKLLPVINIENTKFGNILALTLNELSFRRSNVSTLYT